MPGLADLPPDQRAVLQLVLAQGRDPDELAGLLKISPAAVRARATAGAQTLVAPDPAVPAAEREAVVAHLLGAGPPPRGLSGAGRRWAGELRAALAPIARDELPRLPEPEPEPEPAGVPAEPRSRLGGMLLLGVLGVIAVALVVVLLTRGGDDGPPTRSASSTPTAATNAATTPTTAAPAGTGQNGFRVRLQVNLTPPRGGTANTAGIAQLITQNSRAGFAVSAQGIQTARRSYVGVWLTGRDTKPALVAAITNDQIRGGRFTGLTRVPSRLRRFTEMSLTREAITEAKKPPPAPSADVLLRGALKVPASFRS